MAERKKPRRRFAVCVRNKGYEASLERNKIYLVRPDSQAETDGDIRVVDESGEDYLYPAEWFVAVEVPRAVEENLAVSSDPHFRALIERSRRLYPAGSGLTTEEVRHRARSTRRPGRRSHR